MLPQTFCCVWRLLKTLFLPLVNSPPRPPTRSSPLLPRGQLRRQRGCWRALIQTSDRPRCVRCRASDSRRGSSRAFIPWAVNHIEADGPATWREKAEVVDEESRFDGWYLLTASLCRRQAAKETVFSHYHSLLEVEDAFRETKSYLRMRPIYHQPDDRVRNHIRICFLAYWISARLGNA